LRRGFSLEGRIPVIASYNYQNSIRDLSMMLSTMMVAQPAIISLIKVAEQPARNVKHEWNEDIMQPTQDVMPGNQLVGDVSITVTTGTSFAVNDVWENATTDERFLVTAIAANVLTVTRGVGGTATAMTTGDVLRLVARPKLQGTTAGNDAYQLPTVAFNYTQIFDRTAQVSRTAQNVLMYGVEDQLDYQVKIQMDKIVREMNASIMKGVSQVPSSVNPGRLGGMQTYMEGVVGTGNVVNAAGGQLTRTNLNDVLEKAFVNGAQELTIVCHPHQARKITALDANYFIVRQDETAGKRILRYMGDIAGSQAANTIVVDPTYSKNRIDMYDLSRVALVPLQNSAIRDLDATPPGADYFARRILGEYTLEFKNAAQAHASVYNLGQ
jgi:hypothetical protein